MRTFLLVGLSMGCSLHGIPEAKSTTVSDPIHALITTISASDSPIWDYFLTFYAHRTSPIPDEHLYEPFRHMTAEPEKQRTANALFEIPRTPQKLRDLFEEHKKQITATLSKERYQQLFSSTEALLIKVYYHTTTISEKKRICDNIERYLNAHQDKVQGSGFSTSINPFRPEIFEDLYAKELGTEYEVVWAHSFWYRRYQENNASEVYNILLEIHRMYDQSPPPNPNKTTK